MGGWTGGEVGTPHTTHRVSEIPVQPCHSQVTKCKIKKNVKKHLPGRHSGLSPWHLERGKHSIPQKRCEKNRKKKTQSNTKQRKKASCIQLLQELPWIFTFLPERTSKRYHLCFDFDFSNILILKICSLLAKHPKVAKKFGLKEKSNQGQKKKWTFSMK